jgi:FkbM family methyltransferase
MFPIGEEARSNSQGGLNRVTKLKMLMLQPSIISVVTVSIVSLFAGYLLGRYENRAGRVLSATVSGGQERPLMVSPLLKDLGCGWGNMQIPNLIKKNARGTRSLVVDIGLDAGEEFFHAVNAGFEVVGFEANPGSFQKLASKCKAIPMCQVIDNIDQVKLPLQREHGTSYLIQGAVGKERGTVDFFPNGPTGTSSIPKHIPTEKIIQIPVISLDEVIQEDVYILKIDTQGFDYFVLQGARNLFQSFTVRQVITEMDALLLGRNNVKPVDHMSQLHEYGMQCFTARNDMGRGCTYHGDSVNELSEMFLQGISQDTETRNAAPCWDDLVCINVAKVYSGAVVNPV